MQTLFNGTMVEIDISEAMLIENSEIDYYISLPIQPKIGKVKGVITNTTNNFRAHVLVRHSENEVGCYKIGFNNLSHI